jgi:hypothetical protein
MKGFSDIKIALTGNIPQAGVSSLLLLLGFCYFVGASYL